MHRPRIDMYMPCDRPDGYFRWGSMEGANDGYFAIRMKSDIMTWPRDAAGNWTEDKHCREPGTYCGLIFLISTRNAEPLAFINDGVLQHFRVGGGAAIGVKHLARDDTHTVGMLGSGGMARTFLEAFCCVRDIPWIFDSIERLIRKNMFQPSGIFGFEPGGNVYSRVDGIGGANGMIGYSWNALHEAWCGEQADRLLLVTYETLTSRPREAIDAEGVLREAREQWTDHPAFQRLAYDAAERTANKWTSAGDISCETRGCAVDLIAYYAKAQGIELIERDNEPAVT